MEVHFEQLSKVDKLHFIIEMFNRIPVEKLGEFIKSTDLKFNSCRNVTVLIDSGTAIIHELQQYMNVMHYNLAALGIDITPNGYYNLAREKSIGVYFETREGSLVLPKGINLPDLSFEEE